MALTESVAANIRAELDRQGISFRELGRRLNKPISYVSTRLGENQNAVPIRLEELEEIAGALGVPVARFLPAGEQAAAS